MRRGPESLQIHPGTHPARAPKPQTESAVSCPLTSRRVRMAAPRGHGSNRTPAADASCVSLSSNQPPGMPLLLAIPNFPAQKNTTPIGTGFQNLLHAAGLDRTVAPQSLDF